MITRSTESGFRIALYLARQHPRQVVPLQELARDLGGSPTYLAKIASSLARAGILRSQRGVQGGLGLASSPDQIRLLDVIAAIQGVPTAAYCNTALSDLEVICSYHEVMAELHTAMMVVLEGRTLADLLAQPCGLNSKGMPQGNCRMNLCACEGQA